MYCPNCGNKIDNDHNFCHKCGANLDSIKNVNEQIVKTTPEINKENIKNNKVINKIYTKSGIGGWLLFYIIVLSFGCIKTLTDLGNLAVIVNKIEELKYILYSSSLIAAFTIIWAIISIYLLCTKSKKAIKNIKTFIICQPLIFICDCFIQYYIVRNKFNEEIASKFIKEYNMIPSLFIILLSCFIWYSYFSYSKRVKNTYGE